MTAYVDLIRSYAEAYNRLATLDDSDQRGQPDWADWIRSLSVVYVVADSKIADQAREVDAALWHLTIHSTPTRIPADEWRALRDPLETKVLQFLNLARAELGSLGAPLHALWGRPEMHPHD